MLNTELRVLAAHWCHGGAGAGGTLGVLMMRESEINIGDDAVVSAMKTGVKVKKPALRFERRENCKVFWTYF